MHRTCFALLAALTVVVGSAPAQETPSGKRTVYVPIEKFDDIFDDEGGGVFIPIHELEELIAEYNAGSIDIDRFFEANQAFHLALQEIADNRWLLHVIEDLRKVIKLSRHHSLFSEGRLEQSLAEHRDLLQALLDRDGARAETLMRAHILSGRAALARIADAKTQAA